MENNKHQPHVNNSSNSSNFNQDFPSINSDKFHEIKVNRGANTQDSSIKHDSKKSEDGHTYKEDKNNLPYRKDDNNDPHKEEKDTPNKKKEKDNDFYEDED